jgi:hypothetical protein
MLKKAIAVVFVLLWSSLVVAVFKRQALGRTAELGYLYDQRSEEFIGISVFNDDLPDSMF